MRAGFSRPAVGAGRHVELKRVHQLVADHVIGVGQRTAEREHDAALDRLGDTASALAQLTADHVGLLEVDVRAVQHERLSSAQLVLEQPLEPDAPSLGHSCRDVDAGPLARVEVDVEVFGAKDLEIEGTIVDFVLTEVLCRCRER